MRLAVCQMRSGIDVGANLTEAERLLDEAADAGADLAILPELFPFLGPEARLPEIAEPVPGGASVEMLGKAAARGQLWIAGGSVPERDGEHLFNTAPLFDRSGELVARYRKIHLFDVDLEGQPPFRESTTYRAGTELVTHAMEDLRVGLSICYDLRFPELFRGLMTLGAELFVLPAQFQHQTVVAAAAQWGEFGSPEEPRRSYGRSMIVGPWGDVLVEAPEEGTGVWFADLDVADLRRVRRVLPALEHRRLGSNC